MIECNKCANRCGLKEYYEQRGEHIVECPSYKPPTNADRIRAMTDEELADFLIGVAQRGGVPCGEKLLRWLDWLKQEAT